MAGGDEADMEPVGDGGGDDDGLGSLVNLKGCRNIGTYAEKKDSTTRRICFPASATGSVDVSI